MFPESFHVVTVDSCSSVIDGTSTHVPFVGDTQVAFQLQHLIFEIVELECVEVDGVHLLVFDFIEDRRVGDAVAVGPGIFYPSVASAVEGVA